MKNKISVFTLSDDLSGISFTQDEEGNWGYKPSGADTVIPFKKDIELKTLTPTVLKYFEANTSWTYIISEDCYVQIISAIAAKSDYAYWGKISINNVEVDKYNSNSDSNQNGWAGGYTNVYRCKIGDIIKSEVINSNFAYTMSLIQWN